MARVPHVRPDLLLEQIHSFICTTTETEKVGDRAYTQLRKHQPHHGIEHSGNVSNAQGLSHETIGSTDFSSQRGNPGHEG